MALDVRSAEAGWQLFPQFSELSSRTAASIALIGSQVAECVAPTFSVRNSLISTKHLVSGLACSESAPDPTNSGQKRSEEALATNTDWGNMHAWWLTAYGLRSRITDDGRPVRATECSAR